MSVYLTINHRSKIYFNISRLLVFCFLCLISGVGYSLSLVTSGVSKAAIWIDQDASQTEVLAAREIQYYVYLMSQVELPIHRFSRPTDQAVYIIIKPAPLLPTQPVLTEKDLFFLDSTNDGYVIQSNPEAVLIISKTGSGLIYGSYALIESVVRQLSGLSGVDLDFLMPQSDDIELPLFDIREGPFYPVRATLEVMDPDWLVRHRLNMSGGEGVWTGTGNDDGLGTAFKYVADFEPYQDEPLPERQGRIARLRNRFGQLKSRGIDSYLFMYVTGESTQALIEQRPDLFEPAVAYGGARNGVSYRPFCWSNPHFLQLVRQLIQEIVTTYPDLAGFHLRAWGYETRACNCPKCGDRSNVGQKHLWHLFFTIVEAARQVRPDFKFYLSGYNQSWLRDPDGSYARQLPSGTIFSKKWGYDGEPVTDPNIPPVLLKKLGQSGHQLIVLSHDVEEVMPLWMVEGDLFVEGVRQFSTDHLTPGLGGFTVQGATVGLGWLDQILSARMNFDPTIDHFQLMQDYLSNGYGRQISPLILSAVRINTWVMSSYFSDYAGSSSVSGDYGKGSAMFATRFWDIIGGEAVDDTLAIPNFKQAEYARDRLDSLLNQQQQATEKIAQAVELMSDQIDDNRRRNLLDTAEIFELWQQLFASRLSLVQAIVVGYTPAVEKPQIQVHIQRAIQHSKAMTGNVYRIKGYVPVFGYSRAVIITSLIKKLEQEAKWLHQFPAQTLIRELESSEQQAPELMIAEPHNHPNPFYQRTTFVYELNRYVDQVEIHIYTQSGRLIRRLDDVPTRQGYNETIWDGRDQEGRILPNGIYFYTVSAEDRNESFQVYSRLAILR